MELKIQTARWTVGDDRWGEAEGHLILCRFSTTEQQLAFNIQLEQYAPLKKHGIQLAILHEQYNTTFLLFFAYLNNTGICAPLNPFCRLTLATLFLVWLKNSWQKYDWSMNSFFFFWRQNIAISYTEFVGDLRPIKLSMEKNKQKKTWDVLILSRSTDGLAD